MTSTGSEPILSPFKSVLIEAEHIINGPRRDDYGPALQSFEKIADGWTLILGVIVSPEQVALCMDWLKTCRWLNGQQRDSLVDKAGYTALIQKMQEERSGQGED
jgi:Domain of unknown function (DUF6378)